MRHIFLVLFIGISCWGQKAKLSTIFEKGDGNQTATYQETLDFYQTLAKNYSTVTFTSKGSSDHGSPMYVVFFDASGKTNEKELAKGKPVVLINNLIHPGEPDGNDATQQLFRDFVEKRIPIPQNIIIACIPIYNVGGTLNRNTHSRANQNGPQAYGFRGNARNYDLNRDFIKSDSKNTFAFTEIYHWLKPILFIDNHVSNGADYQYTFTYIQTQHQKLGKDIGHFMNETMTPAIISKMEEEGIITSPYVTVHGSSPDNGFHQMMDTPRYSSGYTSLFGTISYLPETHMLKPYKERVEVTYAFMKNGIAYADLHYKTITQLKEKIHLQCPIGGTYPIQWEIDSSSFQKINFKGFEATYKLSDVTGKNRLYYDRSKPFEKEIPFYSHYKASKSVSIPRAYIIPKAWWSVIERLKANQIQMYEITKPETFEVEVYQIKDYKTVSQPYEGHYLHYQTNVDKKIEKVTFEKGDYIVYTQQPGVKYIIETLEPEAVDSFFNWNFFDTILQQKEGFSDYVFEDIALELLQSNPTLKKEFDEKKTNDSSFAQNARAQLDWIYKRSAYYEKTHNRYPVYRLMK